MKEKPIKTKISKTKNPELEERENLTDLQFLQEMLTQIENRKTQILTNIKQAQDMLKILQIDYKHTKSLYDKERLRRRR